MTRRSFASEDALVVEYADNGKGGGDGGEEEEDCNVEDNNHNYYNNDDNNISMVLILFRGCCNDNDFFQLVQGGVEKLKTEQKFASLA